MTPDEIAASECTKDKAKRLDEAIVSTEELIAKWKGVMPGRRRDFQRRAEIYANNPQSHIEVSMQWCVTELTKGNRVLRDLENRLVQLKWVRDGVMPPPENPWGEDEEGEKPQPNTC